MIDLDVLENAISSLSVAPPTEPLEQVILESLKELRAYKNGTYAKEYNRCPICMDCPKNCPLEMESEE